MRSIILSSGSNVVERKTERMVHNKREEIVKLAMIVSMQGCLLVDDLRLLNLLMFVGFNIKFLV